MTIGLLLTRRGRNVASVGPSGRQATNTTWIVALLLILSHERVVVGIELELLGQLLLRHVESLVMHTCSLLVAVATQVRRQMVTKIDDLSHVLHLVPKSLRTCPMVNHMKSAAGRSEATNTTGQILILRRRTVILDGIQIELRLIRSATDAPLVNLRWNDAALVCLLLVQWSAHLIIH